MTTGTRDSQQVTHGYFGHIMKFEELDDGSLMVYGQAAGPELDMDMQVCDEAWLKSAMPRWFEWGNVREQHNNIAAGVGVELEEGDGGRWMLKSHIVDAGTVKKVKNRTLKGYSLSAVNGAIRKDAGARNGRIVAGDIVEISLVDRPANPACTIAIVKSAGGGAEFVPVGVDDAEGVIEPSSTVEPEAPETVVSPTPAPVVEKSAGWYREALRTVERAHEGVWEGVLMPRIDKAAGGDAEADHADITAATAAVDQILDLIIAEATQAKGGRFGELRDIEVLLSAAHSLCRFVCIEQGEDSDGEYDDGMRAYGSMDSVYAKAWGTQVPDDDAGHGDTPIVKSVSAAVRRRAKAGGDTMPDGSYPITNQSQLDAAVHLVGHSKTYSEDQVKAHIRAQARKHGLTLPSSWSGASAEKAAGMSGGPGTLDDQNTMITKAVAAAEVAKVRQAHEEEIATLRAQLDKAAGTAQTGGPVAFRHVLTKPSMSPQSSPQAITKAAEAKRFRELALNPSLAPEVANAYRERARQLEGETSS